MNRTIEERNKLVEENLGLVPYVCNKLWNWAKKRGFGGEFDDLVSIGSIALIRAAEDYDESRGVKFATFAHTYIKNDLITQTKRGGLIRLPIYSDQQYYETCKRKNRLNVYFKKNAAESAAHRTVSLCDLHTETDFVVIPKQLTIPEQPDSVIASELRDMVMTQLKDSCWTVVFKYFWEDKTIKGIAKEMGLCRQDVNRKKLMAIKQLQKCYGVS
jgi:RNA polymerase sigma factor (sigma-70 family)